MAITRADAVITQAKILVVDDRPENLFAMNQMLKNIDAQVFTAQSGNEALSLMLHHDFAVALLDVQMPEMDGFELATIMHENDNTELIPVIFVTAISKEKHHLFKGYETGAVDYIFKPIAPEILKGKVEVFLRLYIQQKALEDANDKLQRTIEELGKANQTILEQQKVVIEEERLKVLLEMAGASVQELNQPLRVLLGCVDLIRTHREDPEKMTEQLSMIQEAGEHISEVIQKIQTVRYHDVEVHGSQTLIFDVDQAVNILHIDDSEDDFNRVKEFLSSEKNISLLHARTIREGLSIIQQQDHSRVDLIFLDFLLEDGTGFDLMKQLDEYQIPVVIITGQGDELVAAQLIQAGASDYLPKTRLSTEFLCGAIRQAMEKQRKKMDLMRMQSRLVTTSTKDALTGLYNRRYFMESLESELERTARYNKDLALLMIDIDHFKAINDTWGHQTGDEVLSTIAKQISLYSRQNDVVSRYGGEEFAVILPETGMVGARQAGEKIRKAVSDTDITNVNTSLQVTVSVGVAVNTQAMAVKELIEAADKALYRAKENGRDRVE